MKQFIYQHLSMNLTANIIFIILINFSVVDGFAQRQNELNNALIIAAKEGKLEEVKELINQGADVNAHLKDYGGFSALMVASFSDVNIDIVRELIKNGADVNSQDPIRGGTALMMSAMEGTLQITRELISKGAILELKTEEGGTALKFACLQGQSETVKELILHGANINIQDGSRVTPLIIASKNGDSEIVKELVKSGADINIKDNDGKTALYTAYQKDFSEIVSILESAGAKLDTPPITVQEVDSTDVALLNRIDSLLSPKNLAAILADPQFKKNKSSPGVTLIGGVRISTISIPREDNTTLTISTVIKEDTTKPESITVWVKKGGITALDSYRGNYGNKVLELLDPSNKPSNQTIGYKKVRFFVKPEE